MKAYVKIVETQMAISTLTCDRCGKIAGVDDLDLEFQEYLKIDFEAGYASVFGDGNKVCAEFCQACVKEVLGPWLRVIEPEER